MEKRIKISLGKKQKVEIIINEEIKDDKTILRSLDFNSDLDADGVITTLETAKIQLINGIIPKNLKSEMSREKTIAIIERTKQAVIQATNDELKEQEMVDYIG